MNSTPIHICTLNVQGLKQNDKQIRVAVWCKQQKCDILLMQETHFQYNTNFTNFDGKVYASNGESNSRGVAIFFKSNIEYKLINEVKDKDGRFLMVNIELDDCFYSIININAPNVEKNRKSFSKKLKI